MNKIDCGYLSFQDLNDFVRVWVAKPYYYFDVPKSEFSSIADFNIEDGFLFFDCSEKKARNKINMIFNKGFSMIKGYRGKDTLFLRSDFGLPLMGSNEFGLIDRGTNIIEVKPLTGCNLSCVFCSVFEGINDKIDVLVDVDYLLDEFNKLASIKKHDVEANIGPQGEPLLYPWIVELVQGLKERAKVVSINTNGLLLNEKLIDLLAGAGLTRFNLSLHSLNSNASVLSGSKYDFEHVIKMIKYCEGKVDVMLTPLFIPSLNEDLDDVFKFARSIKNVFGSPVLGVQNYLNYKHGRNVVDQLDWDSFFSFLKNKEQELGVKLMLDESSFSIVKDVTLSKPFKKNQVVPLEVVCRGRNKYEFYCSSSDNKFNVTLISKFSVHGKVKAKIVRDKHNIFLAVSP